MAKKSFGQHFLHDTQVIEKILAAARPEDFLHIVEVGPGTGALTEKIVTRMQQPAASTQQPSTRGQGLMLVEADRDLVPGLRGRFPGADIVQADAATVDYALLVARRSPAAIPWLFVSNLPYNAASAIVMRVLSAATPPARLVIMVQKEVGERMLGSPGAMSVLTVAVQTYATVEKVCIVKPGAFLPPPKVDSMVLRLTPLARGGMTPPYLPSHEGRIRLHTLPSTEGEYEGVEPEQVIAFAKAGFANRRKFLSSNLAKAGMASAEAVAAWLEERGFSAKARAEELTVADWLALAERFVAK